MWQLELLSRVIPAFEALAKKFVERNVLDQSLADDILYSYFYITGIRQALSKSQRERTTDLRDDILMGLLKALESRLPLTWSPSFGLPTTLTVTGDQDEEDAFPRLRDLARSLDSNHLGGFKECSTLTASMRSKYMDVIGNKVILFNKKERQLRVERKKFIRRLRNASVHLSDVYLNFQDISADKELSLSHHPSYGTKESVNRAYKLLEQHWHCRCPLHQLIPKKMMRREVRLSLTRYRQQTPQVTMMETRVQNCHPVKFEVLLPICGEGIKWKVTNIEVQRAEAAAVKHGRQLVNYDICKWTSDCDGFQADFLAEKDSLWHLTPNLHDGAADCYTAMESLDQLLGNGTADSEVTKYMLQDTLTLCYILANSMLFLYPGSWLNSAWSSSDVYFVRDAKILSQLPALTFPYLSVKLQESQPQKPRVDQMQVHLHPAVLSLGIIFLEIATGTRFNRSRDTEPWKACNSDLLQAMKLLQDLERQHKQHKRYILPGLLKAIRACLILTPPSHFVCQSIAQEGPIRQYILSCIVQPLARELVRGFKTLKKLDLPLVSQKEASTIRTRAQQQLSAEAIDSPLAQGLKDSYNISLKKLDQPLVLQKEAITIRTRAQQQLLTEAIDSPLAQGLEDDYNISLKKLDQPLVSQKEASTRMTGAQQQSSAEAIDSPLTETDGMMPLHVVHCHAKTTCEERHEKYLHADSRDTDIETRVNQEKLFMTKKWFQQHEKTTYHTLNDDRSLKQVRIAILDSGVKLSHNQKAQYGFDSGVEYRSFIDPEDACTVWEDEDGHGTHLAVLLRNIAENSIICVARVFKKTPEAKSTEKMAEALRYAVDEWKVDIVVMAFGYNEEHDALSEAIDYASSKKVLMFAAASNDGKNRPDGVAWPASRADVFCVHAADGFGNASPFTPSPQDNKRLMTLGECVSSAWPPFPPGSKRKMPNDRKLMSGTSCAATILAGIAAIVLDYGRRFLDEQEWRRLRRYDSMLRMFKELRDEDNTTGYWWIKHWVLFDPKRREPWIQETIRWVTQH